jgi:glutamate-5-semialdehyde dehydrogenase
MSNLAVPGLGSFDDIAAYMAGVGAAARAAARDLARADSAAKDHALRVIGQALRRHADALMAANAADVDSARAA